MKFMFVFALISIICGCSFEVGDFGENRELWYDKNVTDCEKTPQKCIQGYPW